MASKSWREALREGYAPALAAYASSLRDRPARTLALLSMNAGVFVAGVCLMAAPGAAAQWISQHAPASSNFSDNRILGTYIAMTVVFAGVGRFTSETRSKFVDGWVLIVFTLLAVLSATGAIGEVNPVAAIALGLANTTIIVNALFTPSGVTVTAH